MTTFAVVPIFIQAGTSILPALFAGVSTFLFTLLRHLCYLRRLHWKSYVIAAGVSVGVLIIIAELPKARWSTRARAPGQTDWAKVAMDLIRNEQSIPTDLKSSSGGPTFLRPSWEFTLPGASFLSTPIVRDGRIYGASCSIDVDTTFGSIFCLDAITGRPIWQVEKIGNQDIKGIFSSPAITADGKYVIIGEGLHFDQACHLICLETQTGKLHWKVEIPKNHVESSPAISGNFVVVGAGAVERHDHLPVDSPGYALAVRVSDGKILWRRDIIDPESSPVITLNGITCIGSGVGGCAIVALTPTGEQLWKVPTPYPATGPISLGNNLVLAGTGRGDMVNADRHPAGAVVAVNLVSGKIQWQKEFPDAVLGRVVLGNGSAFCPVRDGRIVALEPNNGAEIWSQKITDAPIVAGPALSGHYLYAASSDGFLVILDSKTGRLIEKHLLNEETRPGHQNLCLSTPVISGDRVFVGSETGGLRCFVGVVD